MKSRVPVRFLVSFILLAVAGAIVPTIASAALPRTYETVRVDSPNPLTDGRFGMSIANVGDVNGDGRDDLLTGTDKHGAQSGTGQVAVLSGADPAGAPLRVYTQPDVDDGGPGDRRAGFGNAVSMLSDLGSCPGFTGTAGALCTANPVGAPDGIPEHVVASSGVDFATAGDDLGAVYVFDGASGALLKRIQMPSADRTEQAGGVSTDLANDPRFGRTLLNPAGLPPCDENGAALFGGPGIGTCPGTPPPAAVLNGDVDGDGVGDLLVGATDYSETKATAHPESECAQQAGTANCTGAGRVYVYSGEDIAGSDPGTTLDEPASTIKNPESQPDPTPSITPFSNDEAFGILLIGLGDAGSCSSAAPLPGGACATPVNTTDGRPDFVIVANGVDLSGYSDVGASYEMDGAKLSTIKRTAYPEPRSETSWGIAQNGVVSPPIGDVAQTPSPDYFVGDIQYNGDRQAQGRGLVINGQPSTRGSFREFPSRLIDPTPQNGEQFGLSAMGLGTVVGDSKGEIAVGGIGPHNPGTDANVVNDVTIFDPITEDPLQTISAPDAQGGEAFGVSMQPMGDLNGDGFLDFAVGAGFFDLVASSGPCVTPCSNAGRVYFFLSDNSPVPVDPVDPGPGTPPSAVVRVGRSIEIEASRSSVKKGKRVVLAGLIDSFSSQGGCAAGQSVDLQRRVPGSLDYVSFAQATADAGGKFSTRVKVRRAQVFRARIDESEACFGAVSNRERVDVVKKKKRGGAKKGGRTAGKAG